MPAVEAAPATGRVRTVLLIDDEEDIREVAALALQLTMGWRTTAAAGGIEGVAAAGAAPPDLILLDIMMPEVDGFETLQRLRGDARTAAVPVIFLSAKATPDVHLRAQSGGAVGCIEKPFDPMTLGRRIEEMVGW